MERSTLTHRLLASLQGFVLERARLVLVVSAALAGVAILLGTGVEFRTSRSDLAPPDDPDERRFAQVSSEFAGTSDIIACVEAAPGTSKNPEELRSFADDLAARFREDPLVAQVYHKLDLDWLAAHALYLAPPESLEAGIAAFEEETGGSNSLASVRSLAMLNEAVAARLETGMNAAAPPPEKEAREGIAGLLARMEDKRHPH